jgi:SH3 domain protein
VKTLLLIFAMIFGYCITVASWAQDNSQSVLSRAVSPNTVLANLQTENTQLKAQLEKLQQEHQQLLVDTEDMRQAATTAFNLEEQQQHIIQQNQLLQTEADVLRNENEKLRNTDYYNQLLYGGALILIGVLLSFILQAIGGRRKKHSEWG